MICIYHYSFLNLSENNYLFSVQQAAASLPKTIYPPIEKLQTELLRYKKATSDFICSNIKVPEPIKNLPLLPVYKINPDKTLSTIRDVENENKNRIMLQPITDFKNITSNLVKEMVLDPDELKEIQECLLNTIYKWAQADALTGNMVDSRQGFIERMFYIINTCFGFLKIKQVYLNNEKTIVIQKWLRKIEDSNWSNFKNRTTNLKSWAVLANFLLSISIDDENMYNESINEFVKQVNFIENNGTIKTELQRKDRASDYIVYYADPLITMQYILKFIDNQQFNQPKIHNLVNTVISIKKDPQHLVKTKIITDSQLPVNQKLQFLVLYNALFDDKFINQDNKNILNAQLKLYEKNITDNTLNRGNLYSLFGV
jgi:hypothetical protein